MENLIHAAGFSGHGLMMAPLSAYLIEQLVRGNTDDQQVWLPAPYDVRPIDLRVFEPDWQKRRSVVEPNII